MSPLIIQIRLHQGILRYISLVKRHFDTCITLRSRCAPAKQRNIAAPGTKSGAAVK